MEPRSPCQRCASASCLRFCSSTRTRSCPRTDSSTSSGATIHRKPRSPPCTTRSQDCAKHSATLSCGRARQVTPWRSRPIELDAARFEQLLAEAVSPPEQAADRLRKALALWRGPALADFAYEPFAQSAIARLEELHIVAIEGRIEADLALGRHDVLVGELGSLIIDHPFRERLRRQFMVALYRAGRQADALSAYQEARRMLSDELGVDPSPALKELERAILQHDPSLAASQEDVSRTAGGVRRRAAQDGNGRTRRHRAHGRARDRPRGISLGGLTVPGRPARRSGAARSRGGTVHRGCGHRHLRGSARARRRRDAGGASCGGSAVGADRPEPGAQGGLGRRVRRGLRARDRRGDRRRNRSPPERAGPGGREAAREAGGAGTRS